MSPAQAWFFLWHIQSGDTALARIALALPASFWLPFDAMMARAYAVGLNGDPR